MDDDLLADLDDLGDDAESVAESEMSTEHKDDLESLTETNRSKRLGNALKKVELYNLLGQSVLVVYPNELKTVLNINHLNAATYFMIVSTDTKRKVFKVIKK